MIVNTIFGYPVYKFHCDNPEIYQNKQLVNSIERMLELPFVHDREQGNKYDSAVGEVLTTAGNEYSDLTLTPGSSQLVTWITEQVLKTRAGTTSVKYTRSWLNKMFKESEGLVHAHMHPDFTNNSTEFVAIFYINTSIDSATLTIVKDGEFNKPYTDYPAEQQHLLPCISGDLLIHPPAVFHGVTRHLLDEPRICVVLEGHFNG